MGSAAFRDPRGQERAAEVPALDEHLESGSPPPRLLVRRGVAPAWGRRRARPSAWSPTVGRGASAVRGPFPAHAPPHAMRANPSSHPRIPRTQLACASSPPAARRAPRAASGRFLPGSPALGCCAVTSRPPSAKGRARRKTGPPGREPRDSCSKRAVGSRQRGHWQRRLKMQRNLQRESCVGF